LIGYCAKGEIYYLVYANIIDNITKNNSYFAIYVIMEHKTWSMDFMIKKQHFNV